MPFIQKRGAYNIQGAPDDGESRFAPSEFGERDGMNGSGVGQHSPWSDPLPPPSTSRASPPLPVPSANDDPLAGAFLGIADLVTKLAIVHPCTVLRRQCQVHQHARSLHLTPFTLAPVAFNMISREGILTFWKGSIGSGMLYGLTTVTEIVISDLFGLPRSYVPEGSQTRFWKHVLLKAATVFTMTPFFISGFIETVRSASGLGEDDNRVMEVLVKGVDRMRFAVFGARDASRRFSVLHLAVPTVIFRTSHYVIQAALYHQFFQMAKRYVNRKPEAERTKFHQFLPQIFAQMTSYVIADFIVFPMETVVHRLYIQGTRTLIDNLDTGLSAVSITVKYDGFFDCLRSIVRKEGVWALYAGVGALALEYMLHSLLHQLVRACFDKGGEALRKAAAAHAASVTPPLASAGSRSAPLSGPFAAPAQPLSPILSPRKPSSVSSPIREPPLAPAMASASQSGSGQPHSYYPSFGETSSRMEPFGTPTGRPNVFGSPTQGSGDRPAAPLPPLFLDTHRDDPFGFGQ